MESTSQPRALVLDDDRAVVATICALASRIGVEARGETAFEPFLTHAQTWQPDFVVLDLLMPVLDGVEIIRALAEQDCQASLILISGVGSEVLQAARRTAIERGLRVAGAIAKPLTKDKLRQVIASAPVHLPRPDRVQAAFTIHDLQMALDRDEIGLMFQPQIDCIGCDLTGFEALARWDHPEFGLILPDRFIALAEHGGLIAAITDRVVDQASEFMAAELNDETIGVSINLSMLTLNDLTLADRIAARCADFGIMPERITFELTESGAMQDPASALDLLTRLRLKGFRLSIDDFGTGYSSMLQLVRLPFTEIKIDRSFVSSAPVSAESREVVRSVVALGKGLGLEVVAEGVEDAEMLAYVTALGCDRAQGFYFGKPLRPGRVASWAASWKARRPSAETGSVAAVSVPASGPF